MLNAAKSFRLAFRRASVGKSPSDRKPEEGHFNQRDASTTREPSENQVCESERDVELLYAKLRRVLEKPRFSRLSPATRARVLERLAKDEHPETVVVEYPHPIVRDRAQSTMVSASERSLTYWDDRDEQPETVESETEVDDLVSLTLAPEAPEVQGEAADPALESYHSKVGVHCDLLGQSHGDQGHARKCEKALASARRGGDADDSGSSTDRASPVMFKTSAQHKPSQPSSSSSAAARENQAPKMALETSTSPQVDRDQSSGVHLLSVLVALRAVPFLQACTDNQLLQLYHSEDCLQRRFSYGDEIIAEEHEVLIVIVEGTVNIGKRASTTAGRAATPNTFDKQPQILSAPAYFFGWMLQDQPSGEREAKILLTKSTVSCLIISKSAIQERLSDTTELLGGYHHPRLSRVSDSLRRFANDFVQVLEDNAHESDDLKIQLMKVEASEIEADVVLGRMLRIVEDRLGGSSVALFVVDPHKNRMARLQAVKGASAITFSLPICGVAGLTARSHRTLNVHDQSTDSRFVSDIDIKTDNSFVSIPVTVKSCLTGLVDPTEGVCAFQFTTTSSKFATRPSPDDRRAVEIAATHICSFLRSQRSIRCDSSRSTSVTERFSLSVSSLRVPLSALATVSAATALIAVISMKIFHGEDELSPQTSIVSSRAVVDEDTRIAQFEFLEMLMVPEGSRLTHMPLATRVVLEMSISCKSATTSSFLRRRSTMFQSFSNSMATNAGITTQRQHVSTSRSSISMSQSLTEAEDCSAQSDASATTASMPSREALLTGWSGFFLYGESGEVNSREFSLSLWTESKNIPAPTRHSGLEDPDSLTMLRFCLSVNESSPSSVIKDAPRASVESYARTVCQEEPEDDRENDREGVKLASLKARLLIDPFYRPTQEDRQLLWNTRRRIPLDTRMLPGFLLSVDWKNLDAVTEVYDLLDDVKLLNPPELALRLLSSKFPDPRVREYAIRCLDALEEPHDVGLFMMQLVQALQYERFHDSALARFLLRKALKFPDTLGHQFYWLLKADVHQSKTRERYKVLLDIYLTHTSQSERVKLRNQHRVMKQLEDIHTQVTQCNTMEDKQATLEAALREIDLPSEFVLPLDPSRKLCGIAANECRVLGSKKKPFYLVFNASDGSAGGNDPTKSRTLHVLYKSGDDLRQDQLVLQLFSVMNRTWRRAGSSSQMELVSYGCVSTGPNSGMIEVVREAETIASVFSMKTQRARGSQRGSSQHKFHSALSVLTEQDALTEWLMLHSLPPTSAFQQRTFQKLHRASLSEKQIALQANHAISRDVVIERLKDGGRDRLHYEDAVRNFATSCAASCIASYVLGIGDRHNDNIMISRHGHLFHIDFGHIMGNFKKKFGVKRERTMFVFTPAFAAVLMSESEAKRKDQDPQTVPTDGDDRDIDQDVVKKRETTFLRHLKHTGHSKSCHLESPAEADDGQERGQTNGSLISETSVGVSIPADKRQVWQRSIHASLRFSPRQTSKLDQDANPKRRDSIRQAQCLPAYELFTQLCCDGYNAVRHHVDLLYDLCVLMTCSSLPELKHEYDLEWLRDQLLLGETDDKASAHFLKLIKHSVVSRATLLNDAAHMLKHG